MEEDKEDTEEKDASSEETLDTEETQIQKKVYKNHYRTENRKRERRSICYDTGTV